MSGIAYFEIQADNPESAVSFYGDIFGWQFVKAEGLPLPIGASRPAAYEADCSNARFRLRPWGTVRTPTCVRWRSPTLTASQPRS